MLGSAGLLISAYLVGTHYFAEEVPLACATGGIVDCEQVTSSAESMVGPLPVAVLGLLWFAVFLGILAARTWWPQAMTLQVIWSVAGLLVIFYLVYAELFLIGAICLWCTSIHVIVVALFLMTLWDATAPNSSAEPISSAEDIRDRLRTLG
ncbi:MAG: vitamin K epoxide reductase family protein [Chloroflexi bacterium]|nr:vitamin K epoxide reductase family protein [Chloroflexota bacterium]